MKENEFLGWIREHVPAHEAVVLGVGDDMAVVKADAAAGPDVSNLVLLKIDQVLEGVHFDLSAHSWRAVGRKAVNRCLSDCAAMACWPAAVLVSVALPRGRLGTNGQQAKELFLGCQEAAAAFNCAVVGGDTAVWDGKLVVTVAAMGRPEAVEPVRRSGAQIGDAICVTGELGGSLLGSHMTFVPRVKEARELARILSENGGGGIHAMMDLSDGLAMDLPRLCAASRGVGAVVAVGNLPVSSAAERRADKDGLPAALHALADGEDYELLFTMAEADLPRLFPAVGAPSPIGVRVTRIGTIREGHELRLLDAQDQEHPWPRGGWEHEG